MSYKTHWEQHGIRWVYAGVMSDRDALASNEEFYSDARSVFAKYQIVDFLQVTDVDLTADTVREIARRDKVKAAENPGIKVAFVTTRDVFKGFARMYELTVGDEVWESQIFETEAAAREWLGELAQIEHRPLPTP